MGVSIACPEKLWNTASDECSGSGNSKNCIIVGNLVMFVVDSRDFNFCIKSDQAKIGDGS